jgi:(R,R)-butanediol dehydrogenase/meso-butanediol dehydrogenase/diacetyl reductase
MQPVEFNLASLLLIELNLVMSMGYPTEIFEATEDIAAKWEAYSQIVGDIVPVAEIHRALKLAGSPGETDKVVISIS